jgi:hypothetical protein
LCSNASADAKKRKREGHEALGIAGGTAWSGARIDNNVTWTQLQEELENNAPEANSEAANNAKKRKKGMAQKFRSPLLGDDNTPEGKAEIKVRRYFCR